MILVTSFSSYGQLIKSIYRHRLSFSFCCKYRNCPTFFQFPFWQRALHFFHFQSALFFSSRWFAEITLEQHYKCERRTQSWKERLMCLFWALWWLITIAWAMSRGRLTRWEVCSFIASSCYAQRLSWLVYLSFLLETESIFCAAESHPLICSTHFTKNYRCNQNRSCRMVYTEDQQYS